MTLRSWRDLSTLYDGLRPRIWSLINTEYNVKVNIWTWYNIVQDKDAPGEEGNESQEECNEENKIEEPVAFVQWLTVGLTIPAQQNPTWEPDPLRSDN